MSYITVGPSGATYLFILLFILGAALYTQANLLFWAIGLITGALIGSITAMTLGMGGGRLELSRLAPEYGQAGQPLVVRYTLCNKSRLPAFGLTIREVSTEAAGDVRGMPRRYRQWHRRAKRVSSSASPVGWVLHLGGQQTIQAQALCWPRRRGRRRLVGVVVTSAFPFGILQRVSVFEKSDEIVVLPRVYRVRPGVLRAMERPYLMGERNMDRADRAGEEFFGLRPYHEHDPFTQVDWKHSAKTGELVSREMCRPSTAKVMVELDLRGAGAASDSDQPVAHRSWRSRLVKRTLPTDIIDDSAAEQAISIAASLVCEAYQRGKQFGLVSGGASRRLLPPHDSLPHRITILATLAEIDIAQAAEALPVSNIAPTVIVRATGESTGVLETRANAAKVIHASQFYETLIADDPHAGSDDNTPRVRTDLRAAAASTSVPPTLSESAHPVQPRMGPNG